MDSFLEQLVFKIWRVEAVLVQFGFTGQRFGDALVVQVTVCVGLVGVDGMKLCYCRVVVRPLGKRWLHYLEVLGKFGGDLVRWVAEDRGVWLPGLRDRRLPFVFWEIVGGCLLGLLREKLGLLLVGRDRVRVVGYRLCAVFPDLRPEII